MNCSDGVCKNQKPYFKNFKDDISFEECILYLSLTPILYCTILLFLEEKLFPLLLAKAIKPQLKDASETMDDQVKKEKHVVALEINKISNKSKITFRTFSSYNNVLIRKIQIIFLCVVAANIELQELKTETATNRNSEALQSPISEGDSLFLVYELSKYYGKLMAVREISFRVKPRECFGLLGVNGAGKSTSFRLLTGEEMSNSGIMYLGGASILSNRKQVTTVSYSNVVPNAKDTFARSIWLRWAIVRKLML